MSFSNPINIATATMEQIYERLCWVYAALRSTVIFDAIGNSYQLSVITQLTRGKIPYPERFYEMVDYKQTSIIQNLQTKDVLCTRTDWARIGRLYHTMPEYYDEEGQELFYQHGRGTTSGARNYCQAINPPTEQFPNLLAGSGQYNGWEISCKCFRRNSSACTCFRILVT